MQSTHQKMKKKQTRHAQLTPPLPPNTHRWRSSCTALAWCGSFTATRSCWGTLRDKIRDSDEKKSCGGYKPEQQLDGSRGRPQGSAQSQTTTTIHLHRPSNGSSHTTGTRSAIVLAACKMSKQCTMCKLVRCVIFLPRTMHHAGAQSQIVSRICTASLTLCLFYFWSDSVCFGMFAK